MRICRKLAVLATLLASTNLAVADVIFRGTPHVFLKHGADVAPDKDETTPTSPGTGPLSVSARDAAYHFDFGEEWNVQFLASGGRGSYGYVTLGAPSGISASAQGVMRGVAQPDIYENVRMRVTDEAGGEAHSAPVTIVVGDAGILAARPATVGDLDVVAPRRRGTTRTVTFRNDGERPVPVPPRTVEGPFEIVDDRCDGHTVLRYDETCDVDLAATLAEGETTPSASVAGLVELSGTLFVGGLEVALSGVATGFDPRLVIPSSIVVSAIANGAPMGACTSVGIRNDGFAAGLAGASLSIAVNPARFQPCEPAANACTQAPLAPGSSCALGVRLAATGNGTFTGSATVSAEGQSGTVALTGTASGFPCVSAGESCGDGVYRVNANFVGKFGPSTTAWRVDLDSSCPAGFRTMSVNDAQSLSAGVAAVFKADGRFGFSGANASWTSTQSSSVRNNAHIFYVKGNQENNISHAQTPRMEFLGLFCIRSG